MNLTKLNIIEGITCTLGSFGAAAVLLGGGACLIGLGSVSTIKLAESLSHHRPTIQRLMFYGSATAGAGLFLIGSGTLIAKENGERICDEELQRVNSEIEEAKQNSKYSNCNTCKYYSGEELLPCAVHSTLKEDCADWEPE